MPHEISLGGIYLPGTLVLAVLMLPCFWLLDLALARVGLYRRALHPALVRVSLFTALFCGAVLTLF
jgi:hypothetical protein